MGFIHSIEGTFTAKIYNKSGDLVSEKHGKNSLSKEGFKRICKILVQGFSGKYGSESLVKTSSGGIFPDSDSVNLKILEWKDRKESTFNSYLLSDDMFQDDKETIFNQSSLFQKLSCDFGQRIIYNEEYVFDEYSTCAIDCYNVKFGSIIIRTKEGVELVEGTDFTVLDYGDYKTKPTLSISNSYYNVNLYITYTYFSIPSKPIVGFCFDYCCSQNVTNETQASLAAQNFISGWAWSLSQGKDYLPCFFPNVSGLPSGSSNFPQNSLSTHSNSWFSMSGENVKRYYFTSLPWGVINPTQLAWYFNKNINITGYFSNFI